MESWKCMCNNATNSIGICTGEFSEKEKVIIIFANRNAASMDSVITEPFVTNWTALEHAVGKCFFLSLSLSVFRLHSATTHYDWALSAHFHVILNNRNENESRVCSARDIIVFRNVRRVSKQWAQAIKLTPKLHTHRRKKTNVFSESKQKLIKCELQTHTSIFVC